MRSSILPVDLRQTARQLRVVALLDGAERIGLTQLSLQALHSVAYFADALAPVWNLPILDGQIIKLSQPYYPSLQHDVDHLVGVGVLSVSNVDYQLQGSTWTLRADYELRHEFADPILSIAESYVEQARELAFVREVVYATSGLGLDGLGEAPSVDATYSDPLVDLGGMIDIRPDDDINLTAQVALRFGDLMESGSQLSGAEMVNLYVRQLYSRMQVA